MPGMSSCEAALVALLEMGLEKSVVFNDDCPLSGTLEVWVQGTWLKRGDVPGVPVGEQPPGSGPNSSGASSIILA